jgi:FRG domain
VQSPEPAPRPYERARGQPLQEFAKQYKFKTVRSLLDAFQEPPFLSGQWAFRGQGDWDWGLLPTIERIPGSTVFNNFHAIDRYVIHRFKERAHHYIDHPPEWDDELEWRALARHYGAPSRLLDWTRSPYIAAFFAAVQAKPEKSAAVWAIDIVGFKSQAIRILKQHNKEAYGDLNDGSNLGSPKHFRRIFGTLSEAPLMFSGMPPIVVPLQPSRTNE